jgi:hypothetical protein
MSVPTTYELLGAAAAILAGVDGDIRIVIDPLYEEDGIRYAAHVYDSSTGRLNGWVIEAGQEEPPRYVGPGIEQSVYLALHAFTEVQTEWSTGVTSLEYHHTKVGAAKTAFALAANRALGLDAAGVRILEPLHAPGGHLRLRLDAERNDSPILHYSPLQAKVWIRDC